MRRRSRTDSLGLIGGSGLGSDRPALSRSDSTDPGIGALPEKSLFVNLVIAR